MQNTIMAIGNRVIAQSDEMGALPTLYAATQDLPGGELRRPRTASPSSAGTRRSSARSARASDPETAKRLWDLSEQLTGVAFPLAPRSAPSVTEAAH